MFFSHSTRDRDALMPIRNRLLEGTGKAIEVFMSSDGASIPFGTNWLKEIEQGLQNCRLMFVWLTPASLRSNWILFESGYAYSKGVKVVTIGFQGVKLEELPAPLSLLQGFNVSSAGSLNNLVAVVNREFTLEFPDLFDEAFYRQNVADVTSESSPELLKFVRSVTCDFYPSSEVGNSGEQAPRDSGWWDILQGVLKDSGCDFKEHSGTLIGIGFRVRQGSAGDTARVLIDPLGLNSSRHYWALATERMYAGKVPYTHYSVEFVANTSMMDDPLLIASRLLNSEVSFDTNHRYLTYRFGNIEFRLLSRDALRFEQQRMLMFVPNDNDAPIPLLSLMRLLHERQVITLPN